MSEVKDWNTSAASNNSAAPDGFPEGMAPSGVNDAARETMAAIKRWYDDISGVNTSGGSSSAYTLTAAQTISAYAAGNAFAFVANHANTGASTLNVDSVGAKSIKKYHDQDLVAGDIEANQLVVLIYQATDDVFEMVNPRPIGKQTIWVPAAAMQPTASNGCAPLATVETTAGRPDMNVLDFDASSDEHAQFQVAFPKGWDEGTVTFQAYWTSTATDTDGVAWGLQGVSVSDDGTIDVSYGTAVVVTDDNISAAEDCLVTSESSAVTIAGSPAEGDLCFFRVFRDVSDANDDMTEDARLIGIKLFFTTDAPSDN